MSSTEIRNAIHSKSYYTTNGDGCFDWQQSIRTLAEQIGLSQHSEIIQTVIENAFTPEALTTVMLQDENGEEMQRPFIQCLTELGVPLFLWTEGNANWQSTKYTNTGVSMYIPPEQILCAAKEKETLIHSKMLESNGRHKRCFIVIDDKRKNLQQVQNVQIPADSEVELRTFHMDIESEDENPTSVFFQLKLTVQELSDQEFDITVFTDMDGVVINTDRVMNGEVIDALELMKQNFIL